MYMVLGQRLGPQVCKGACPLPGLVMVNCDTFFGCYIFLIVVFIFVNIHCLEFLVEIGGYRDKQT